MNYVFQGKFSGVPSVMIPASSLTEAIKHLSIIDGKNIFNYNFKKYESELKPLMEIGIDDDYILPAPEPIVNESGKICKEVEDIPTVLIIAGIPIEKRSTKFLEWPLHGKLTGLKYKEAEELLQ